MAGSLQDQLLKAGIVTEEQLAEARARPRPAADRRRGKGGTRGAGARGAEADGGERRAGEARGKDGQGRRRRRGRGAGGRGAAAAVQDSQTGNGRQRARQGARSGAAQAQQEMDPAERALRQKVHGLISDNAESREDGETAYHFVKGSRIKRIYVTDSQRDRLADGGLAVAAMKGRHYLIPMAIAEQIRGLIPEYFVAMGASHTPEGDGSDVDEEYADYQVPDDLTW